MSGRQSPGPAIDSGNPGGQWKLIPSLKAYQTNTSNYDSMPSGHLAIFMATITVIATNHPEIKWIEPVGYSLMGTMAFEMMSSKVYWASDYPSAILIGYVVGKTVANRRIIKKSKTEGPVSVKAPKFKMNLNFTPHYRMAGLIMTF